ncbi:protein of unknown function [Kyrpidia spormannii]|uniref:Uncharacterized protein n=2 Tax=Kyrpidia spormannii TaxID=2055160 RepID=A0ACA8Z9Z9_9BACL|nr:protein of unknown function [Kyrpidia spormannii]CAB3393964.1 protein of unknown function [Kyrpidia spormannii]
MGQFAGQSRVGEAIGNLRRGVGGTVLHHNHFISHAGSGAPNRPNRLFQMIPFIPGGQDDADLGVHRNPSRRQKWHGIVYEAGNAVCEEDSDRDREIQKKFFLNMKES